jgi:hypothetical protein
MGWYTSDTNGAFEFKYGNVIALARSSGLGVLELLPRVSALDADGESLDAEEFLGPLQRWALAQGLAWKAPLPFVADEHHESIVVPLDVDMKKTQRSWVGNLRTNKESLVAALRHFNDYEDGEISSLTLGIEAHWSLPTSEYEALCRWLSAHGASVKGKRTVSFRLDAFQGREEASDDVSEELSAAFASLPAKDEARQLAAYALRHATSRGTPLDLFMPDDDYQVAVWGD